MKQLIVYLLLMQELKELNRSKVDDGVVLEPSEANIYVWKAFIKVCSPSYPSSWGNKPASALSSLWLQGAKDTPFEEGTFELDIKVPDQYPLVPPNVRYRTKIFHPNIHFKVQL